MYVVLLAVPVCFAQTGPGSPVSLTGQIFLPDGDVPQMAIGFELTDEDQTMHLSYFTDENGRFLLEGLRENANYLIFVKTDDGTWADTTHRFMATRHGSVRFELNPFKGTKLDKPASTVSAASAGYKPSPKAAELNARGLQALKDGHLPEAQDFFKQAIVADARYVDAFNDLAVTQLRLHQYAEAEKTLRRGLEADPKSASLESNLGAALNHQDRFADAVAPLEEALRLDPTLAPARVQLGVALYETGNLGEAQLQLEQARTQRGDKASEDPILQLYLGQVYARTGEFKQSIAAFNLYLAALPNSANAPAVKAAIARMQSELAKNP
jgi:tetratricopeptide (TPR) repeat protein